MTKVKIIRGFYGHRTEQGVKVKSPREEAFEVEDAEAERIVSLGVAAYVATVPAQSPPAGAIADNAVNGSAKSQSPAEDDYEGNNDTGSDADADADTDVGIPAYGPDTGVAELRAIAKKEGIVFKFGISKTEMLAVLDEHFGVMDAPDLSAETPVV